MSAGAGPRPDDSGRRSFAIASLAWITLSVFLAPRIDLPAVQIASLAMRHRCGNGRAGPG